MQGYKVSEYSLGVWPTVDQTRYNRLHKRPNARIRVGHYHTLPQSKGNLYQAVRRHLGLSRDQMGKAIGITEAQLRYRERTKRMYHPCEVVALHVISGMTWDDFGKLLNDIA